MEILSILAQNSNEQGKMSSKEIALLTGKEHSHVLRDIRVMLDELQKEDPNLDPSGYQVVTAQNNMTAEILLDEELSLCLGAGYSVSLRMKIIKRWKELELANKPKPMTMLESAKALVASLELIEKQKTTIDNMSVVFKHESEWLSILKVSIHNKVKETEFKWQLLKRVSIELGYEVKKMPSRRYEFQNIYHSVVWKKCYPTMNYNFPINELN